MRLLFIYLLGLSNFIVVFSVSFRATDFNAVTAREPFPISWDGALGSVIIILRGSQVGAIEASSAQDLPILWTIDSQLSGNSFVWNVPITLPSVTLALEIRDDIGATDFSPMFGVAKARANTTESATDSITSPSSEKTLGFSASSSSATSTQQSPATSAPTFPITPAQNPPPAKRFTTAFKIAIAIGASLGSLAILGIIFFAFRYRKRSASRENIGDRAKLGTGWEANEKVELGDTGILEAEGNIPLSVEEKQAVEEKKEEERRKGASDLEGGRWKWPVVIG